MDLTFLDALEYQNIVISPGPGHPDRLGDFGICKEIIAKTKVPLLGICLGHQGIGSYFGGKVVHAPEPMHGRISLIYHDGTDLFSGIPSPFKAVRYHSLCVEAKLPKNLKLQAWTDDGVVMGIRHAERPIWGLQFHPESICSEYGHQIFANFRRLTEDYNDPDNPFGAKSKRKRLWADRIWILGPKPFSGTLYRCSSGFSYPNDYPPKKPTLLSPSQALVSASLSFQVRVKKLDYALCTDLEFNQQIEQLFETECRQNPACFWLDSQSTLSDSSCFSFMGDATGPYSQVITYVAASTELTIQSQGQGKKTVKRENIFAYLKKVLNSRCIKNCDLPFSFQGGFVGYFGYETKNSKTYASDSDLSDSASSASSILDAVPDAAWIFADRFTVFDHLKKTIYLLVLEPEWVHEGDISLEAAVKLNTEWFHKITSRLLLNSSSSPALLKPPEHGKQKLSFTMRHSRADYLDKIQNALRSIQEGESYEVCLTNSIETEADIDPFLLYRTLRKKNPSPFGAFLHFSGFSILSSSPERFLKIDSNRTMEAKPIKGTCRRGRDQKEDLQLKNGLQTDEKARSENLMIVDLLRNDLGKVAELNSVNAVKLMEVETYSTVHQLVSTIQGQLREDFDLIDAIQATFPGGSMTGAPKIRTIEILEQLEEQPRGPYSGVLGYLGLNGTLDLSILIRTIVNQPPIFSIGSGGAIIALSEPESEYEEMLLKAKASLEALSEAYS